MIILGISGATDWNPFLDYENWVHGASVSLVIDGVYVASLEEERFTRQKYDGNFPKNSINKILARHNLTTDDVDIVAYVTCCNPNFYNTRMSYDKKLSSIINSTDEKFKLNPSIKKTSKSLQEFVCEKFKNAKLEIVDHHLAHASASFLTSDFEESSVLTLDSGGDTHVVAYTDIQQTNNIVQKNFSKLDKTLQLERYIGAQKSSNVGIFGFQQEKNLSCLDLFYDNFTIGSFYRFASTLIMRDIQQKENGRIIPNPIENEVSSGKVMGLSAYGDHNKISKYNLDHFYHIVQPHKECLPKIIVNAVEPNMFFSGEISRKIIDEKDWALLSQKILEKTVLSYFQHLPTNFKKKKLCFGGGVAMNIILNTKLIESGIFEDVHIPTAPNDNGLSLGAALYVAKKNEKEIKLPKNLGCVGLDYSDAKVLTALQSNSNKISYKQLSDFELYETAASLLKENKIIAWHQGRSEYGPRALGNRSIFANPSFDNKQHLNEKVKFREWWRPYAGMVMLEHLHDWFILPRKDSHYMLFNSTVREEKRELLKSVTHVDNSCRVQSVSEEINERAYKLLEKFNEKTGVPVLLNTSFNTIPGEPIVETPEDAIKSFLHSKIDALFINNYMVTKL